MESVIAVIVTYNRLSLLKDAIASVKLQTCHVKEFLVIDNGCTDGTAAWLDEQEDITVVHIPENIGASGGFHAGIKAAASHDADWIWVMDDDTICNEDTLTALVKRLPEIDEPVGFIGSKCIWLDGNPHYMNVPAIKPSFNNRMPFNRFDASKLILTETTSWVSLLINVHAVKQVGLPYKEFFFWSDDCEYTRRITKAGYLGFYSMESVVIHKTAKNYCPDFYRDTVANLWKHGYGFRNEFYLKKKYNGFLYFFFWLFVKVAYTSLKLMRIRKDHQLKFIAVLCRSAWQSIFFNPKVDSV